jgi:hypothetical protein
MKNFGHSSLFSGIDSNQVPPEIEIMLYGHAELKTVITGNVVSAGKYRLSDKIE